MPLRIADDFANIATRLREMREHESRAEPLDCPWWCDDCRTTLAEWAVASPSDRPGTALHCETTGGCGCIVHQICGTCANTGWIDQSVGGYAGDPWAQCPDCANPFRKPHP